ncbi:glycosyltransferase family 4 protein [Xylariomycetidae sp. FL2044]|nr:glycosyltransferase family 4 protein [Xylariomycetidae sp. FL2044]
MTDEKTKKADDNKRKKTIVFLHPDLGIGGAERLVVDAAVGLQNRGHKVVIFTSHCDPKHCFDEARDGTLDVRVRGNTLVPPSIFSRFSILCAILRQLHLILQISLLTGELGALNNNDSPPDAYFVDQLSAGLPLLRFLQPRGRIFFYCHFPDLLLARGRARWWKRLYRVPFDGWERWSMGFADAVAVNSDFTKGVVRDTWPALARDLDLRTVYPCVDTKTKTPITARTRRAEGGERVRGQGQGQGDGAGETIQSQPPPPPLWKGIKVLLSINRYERKKDIALAIRAFAGLPPPSRQRGQVRLAIAGGYDPRVAENVTYHRELESLCESLSLRHRTVRSLPTAAACPRDVDVLFLHSVPAALKDLLLASADLLVYTPAREHFGIVPLEAMLAGVPVLAADTGGPVETVVEGVTGWLRSPAEVGEWTEVMDRVLNRMGADELRHMREAGARRVKERFGEEHMAERLDGIFDEMLASPPRRDGMGVWVGAVLVLVLGVLGVLGAVVGRVWFG